MWRREEQQEYSRLRLVKKESDGLEEEKNGF